MTTNPPSSSRSNRAVLEDCLTYVREGDVLVITRLDRLARSIVDLREIVSKLEAMGNEVRGGSPDEMRTMIASEITRWKQVIGEEWVSPNDPRVQMLNAGAQEAAE